MDETAPSSLGNGVTVLKIQVREGGRKVGREGWMGNSSGWEGGREGGREGVSKW